MPLPQSLDHETIYSYIMLIFQCPNLWAHPKTGSSTICAYFLLVLSEVGCHSAWYPAFLYGPYLILLWLWLCLKIGASLVAQRVKHLPAMRETRVRSLGREDPVEKEMATHSSTLAWKIPWTEKPGRLQSMGLQRVGHDWVTSHTHTPLKMISEIGDTTVCFSQDMLKFLCLPCAVLSRSVVSDSLWPHGL